MSKYVKHKHGISIGSDNQFWVSDTAMDEHDGEPPVELPEGVSYDRDGYKAILSIVGYKFDRFDSLNVNILTPAQQLVFRQQRITWTSTWEHEGTTYTLPKGKNYVLLAAWVEKWLTDNVGPKYTMWDCYTRANIRQASLFFLQRRHAVAFARMVDERLKGIKLKD